MTDGRHGAFLGTHGGHLFCPVLETKVAGTAGAGDAFNSTFTAYIALGRPPEEALRAAAVNAASVVGHVDTQTGPAVARRDRQARSQRPASTLPRAHMVALRGSRPTVASSFHAYD